MKRELMEPLHNHSIDEPKQAAGDSVAGDKTDTPDFDPYLAVEEAVRRSTPRRRQIKLVRKKFARPKPPSLTIEKILAWADSYRIVTGLWPNKNSGPIAGTPSENWAKVSNALRLGL